MRCRTPRPPPRRRKPVRIAAGLSVSAAVIIVAACLSGEDVDSDGLAVVVADSEDGKATTPAAPPPGGIVDSTTPAGWTGEGHFSVNHNGAAEYDVPLWTPAARRGFGPKISLHYNSGAGNGLAGVGWSVTGFSSIMACGKTFAADAKTAHPDFGAPQDRWCL